MGHSGTDKACFDRHCAKKNPGPKVITIFVMLNDDKHEIDPAHKC